MGPSEWRVQYAKQRLQAAVRPLEYVASFRVLLGATRTNNWQPKGRTRRRHTVRRPPPQEPHVLLRGGTPTAPCWRCANCPAKAATDKGRRLLGRAECQGRVLLEKRLGATLRRVASSRRQRAVAEDPGGEVATPSARGHTMYATGPYIFCGSCGAYASERGNVALASQCHRRPANWCAKSRRDRLLRGLDPLTQRWLGPCRQEQQQ